MPKLKLLQEPDVVAFIEKRVAQAESAAAKNAQRHYRNIVRSVKEAISTSSVDKKSVKGLTTHVLTALAEHAPAAQAAE